MSKPYVIIDDSGDPGLKASNTARFIVAAVVVADRENLEKLSAGLAGFRAGLGWGELDEIKFTKTRKSIVTDLLRFVCRFDFKAYAVVINKSKMTHNSKQSSESLYNYAIKELLLNLKLSEAVVLIDGTAYKTHAQKTRTYLRQALRQHSITGCEFAFVDSRKDPLVQLADVIAGSVARSYDTSKTDHKDYLELLRPKIKKIYELSP